MQPNDSVQRLWAFSKRSREPLPSGTWRHQMAVILVPDAEQRSALATVRSLGAAGHEVHTAFRSELFDLAGRSRFSRERWRIAGPSLDPRAFAEELAAIGVRVEADLVLPVTDASVQAVLEHAHLFEQRVLPLPTLESYRMMAGKDQTLAIAEKLGMETPAQTVLSDPGQVDSFDAQALGFPVVLKPVRSIRKDGGEPGAFKVAYARTKEDLLRRLAQTPRSSFPLLVQQKIEGPGIGLFFLLWNGRLLARFAHRRMREKPPSGGVSVFREGIAFDEELGVKALRLLRDVSWQGAAMVEFKVDRITGTPYLMEVNGRFWGSLQLAIDSGVDFPALLVDAALGQNPEPLLDYAVGRKCRWLWGDTEHLILRLARTKKELNLVSTAPGRIQCLLAYAGAFRPGIRTEVWRWTDPGPFLFETRTWARRAMGRGW